MRKMLMMAGVPLAAGALVLSGFTATASATSSPRALPTYTIGYEGPLSGGYAALGLNMKYAIQYAVAKWNSTSGRKFNLKARFLDDQGNPQIAPTDAQIAISDKNLVAMVGPAFSGATKAAQSKYGPANMPLVSPSATNPLLGTAAENPHKNFFRVVADDIAQGSADANFTVNNLKDKNIYVINDGSTYGAGLASAYNARARADHAKTTTNTLPETGGCTQGGASTSEYNTIGSLVASSGAKLVFYGGYYCDASLLITALRNQGYTGRFMSGDGTDDPHFVSGATPPSKANGSFLSCACAQLGASAADKAFAKGFEKYSHGVAPGTYSAESYDATNVLIAAINKLLSQHKAITRANIVAALHGITFVGLTKKITFKAYGNIAITTVYMNQVKSGKIVQLGVAS